MKTPTQQFQLRLPEVVHRALKEQAQQQERSINWLINKILAQAVDVKQDAKQ